MSEDPIRDGLNFYTYCLNNPVLFIDPSGLDSYIYYDKDIFDHTKDYIPQWQQSLADVLYEGDTSKIHLIALAPTKNKTSSDIFTEAWDKMAKDLSIDVIIFHGHGSDKYQYMRLADDLCISASDSQRADIEKGNKSSDLININSLTPIAADYFLLFSCNQGIKSIDYPKSAKGLTNFASDIVLGTHTVNNSVIASDGNGSSSASGGRKSTGDGYRAFSWNGSTNLVDSYYLGNDFKSVADLIFTQMFRSQVPQAYQMP